MKRFITWILVLLMVIGIISCSSMQTIVDETKDTIKEEFQKEKDKNSAEDSKATEKPELEPVSEHEAESEPEPESVSSPETAKSSFDQSAKIDETVLVDSQGVKITATELTFEKYYGAVLSLLIENSNEFDITVVSGSISSDWNYVNGYMAGGYVYEEVAAGKKAISQMRIDLDKLKLLGMKGISEIGIAFLVQKEDHSTLLESDIVSIETSFKGDSDTGFIDTIQDSSLQKEFGLKVDYISEEIPFESNIISIESVSLITNSSAEQRIFLDVNNHSDQPIRVQTSNIVINGVVIENGIWNSEMIAPGKKSIIEINYQSMACDENLISLLGISPLCSAEIAINVNDKEGNSIEQPDPLQIRLSDKDVSAIDQAVEVYNENDVRILYLGTVKDSQAYSDDMYIAFLVTNNAADDRRIDIEYNSLSVNGFMANSLDFDGTVKAGKTGLLILELMDPSKIHINAPDEIESIEFGFEIKDVKHHKIANGTVTVNLAD